jgi:hypothetical protein
MMKIWTKGIFRIFFAGLIMALAGIGYKVFAQEDLTPEGNDIFKRVTYLIDFSDYEEGSVEKWLELKGFAFEKDAKKRDLIELDFADDGLVIEARKRVRGFLFNESVDIEKYSTVKIEWGILKYPEGASYEKKINNEALMVYIFFGYDKISSGHFLVPNSPYFIGLYLGENDTVDKAYKGMYFHKGGRFVCVGNPKPGETVTTEFDLVGTFKAYFEKDELPVITGISLGVDTSSSGDGGKAGAFINSIEFLE